jgi:hypothetical protein
MLAVPKRYIRTWSKSKSGRKSGRRPGRRKKAKWAKIAVPKRSVCTWLKWGILAAVLGWPVGVSHDPVKPLLVYHNGDNILFSPEATGTYRRARLGPWELGERLSPDQEKLSDQRLNLYVVVPGGQYHSASHPEYDHNLVINKYLIDHKSREWDIFWCLELDPSLGDDLRSERDILQAAQQRFQPAAAFVVREIPAGTVIGERLSVTKLEGLKRFRHKDGSLPRILIVPAQLAVRARTEKQK